MGGGRPEGVGPGGAGACVSRIRTCLGATKAAHWRQRASSVFARTNWRFGNVAI